MVQYRFLSLALSLLVALAASSAASPVHATNHSVFGSEETHEIERIVGDYIRNNPEIIVDAFRQLEDRRRLAEAEQLQRQIAQEREALINDPGSPVGGNPNGDVAVVEFFDYRCPYCKVVAPALARLIEDDANLRFVYKEWPILGPVSVVAARAALAAREQGLYVAFHDRLMSGSEQLSEKMIFDIAEDTGLNVEKLRQDMELPEIEAILQRNAKLAARLRITGTPAFVIGDVLVPGAVELSDLKALVEEARSGG